MPFKSRAQAAYFNANKELLESKGVNVDEWNRASKGKIEKLPKHTKHTEHNKKTKTKYKAY
jgi:hypothetical protein